MKYIKGYKDDISESINESRWAELAVERLDYNRDDDIK
jgi:hypothetical protein